MKRRLLGGALEVALLIVISLVCAWIWDTGRAALHEHQSQESVICLHSLYRARELHWRFANESAARRWCETHETHWRDKVSERVREAALQRDVELASREEELRAR